MQERGINKQDIEKFQSRLEECNLSVENALAINQYSNGSNMILSIKKGIASKAEIKENIFSELKEKLEAREMDVGNFDEFRKIIQELDYNKPVHENYDMLKNALEKLDIPKNCLTSMNSAIKNFNSLEHIYETIKQLDDGLSKARLPESMKVYRAIKSNPDMNLKELEGQMAENKGYTSTSPIYDSSFAKYDEYNTVLELYLPKGTKGIYIDDFSDYEGTEHEVLLDANDVFYTNLNANVTDKNGKTKNILSGVVFSKDRECYKEAIDNHQINKQKQDAIVNSESSLQQNNLPYKQNKFFKMWYNLRGKFVKNRIEKSSIENRNGAEMGSENETLNNEVEEKNEFKEGLKNQTYTLEEITQKDMEVLQQPVQEQMLQQPIQQMPVSQEMII